MHKPAVTNYQPRHKSSAKTQAKVLACIESFGPMLRSEIVANVSVNKQAAADAVHVLHLKGCVHIAAWVSKPGRHCPLFAAGNKPDVANPDYLPNGELHYVPSQPLPPLAWLINQPLPNLSKHT